MSRNPLHPDEAPSTPAGAVAVIVFARAPVPGHAKTRLIPVLGAQGAAALAQRMLEHAVAVACNADIGPVELCVTPNGSHAVFDALRVRHGIDVIEQGEGDLGARMHRALERALSKAPAAILFGTDLPDLDAHALRSAATALNDHDAVFVPALDGGYGLVGLRHPAPALFCDIAWSTSEVMPSTRVRAGLIGLRIAELPPVADIDEPGDLNRVPKSWLSAANVVPPRSPHPI